MKKILLLTLVALLGLTSQAQQLDLMQVVPNDSSVRVGTLQSGIKYYIKSNKKDPQRANFHIVYNVGAVQELDNQNGLAHFLEHMAFNGSKNFPDNSLIDYLQSIGVRFGENLNAGTGQERTTYMITNVPITRQGIIDSALLALHDWAGFISLNDKDIDEERGVITEEWRQGNTASRRVMEAQAPTMYANSIYAKRNVIGNEKLLQSFTYDDIKSFYHQWYRPDMQAFVIVGDFDAAQMEAKLKTVMSDIQEAQVKTPKEVVVIQDNEQPLINIASDPEYTGTISTILFRHKPIAQKYNNKLVAFKNDVVTSLVSSMFQERCDELSKQDNAPFLGAFGQYFNLVEPFDVLYIGVQSKDGESLKGLEAIYTELLRMQRGGFTSSEFDRAKSNMLSQAQSAYENRNDMRNSQFVNDYMDNFLNNTPYATKQTELELTKMVLDGTSLEEVNAVAQGLVRDKNSAIMVSSPEKEGIIVPTQEQVTEVMAKVKDSKIELYVDQVITEPLVSDNLKGSKIISTEKGQYGSTVWNLKNGVRVVLKKTDFKADEIILNAFQKGGTSLIEDPKELFSIEMYRAFENLAGLGQFTSTELTKMLTGKIVSLSPQFDQVSQGFTGSCSPKDFETMMQLTYMYMVHPRFQAKDFNNLMTQLRAVYPNLVSNPDFIAMDSTQQILYGNSPRIMKLDTASLNLISLELMEKAYRKLLSNAAGMTFTIVGNYNQDEIKPLVEKYLGSLPASKMVPKIGKNFALPIDGKKTVEYQAKQKTPKVTASVAYTGKVDYDINTITSMAAIKYILDIRYTKSIREEAGGTYGVQTSIDVIYTPFNRYSCEINFNTDPAKIAQLLPIVYKEIDDLIANGPSAENLNKAKEFFVKKFAESNLSNGTWASYFSRWYRFGYDPYTDYLKTVEAMTPESIKAVAAKAFTQSNIVTVVQLPQQ